MITVVTVWLCLIACVKCNVIITINSNGSDNDTCCIEGNCSCSSLSSALHNMSDNTLINITSESVTLHDIVAMGSGNLNNIIITGNGATIMCNNTGGVYCESCSNVTIMGITWYQCGYTDPGNPIHQTPALKFINVSKILIHNCTFQNSSGCPVYMLNATEDVSIIKSKFLTNLFYVGIVYHVNNYSFCAGLYISLNALSFLAINDSRFDGNGYGLCDTSRLCSYPYFSAHIVTNNVVSLPYSQCQFVFKNTNFSKNSNGLNLKVTGRIVLSNVNVHNNTGVGISIQMKGVTHSSGSIDWPYGYVSMSSMTFVNNDIGFSLIAGEDLYYLKLDICNSTFSNTPNGISQLGIDILLSVSVTDATVSNSIFHGNQRGAVSIEVTNQTECITASISFVNVTVYNTTNVQNTVSESASVYIATLNTLGSIVFDKVNFTSNHFPRRGDGVLIIKSQFKDCYPQYQYIIGLYDCTVFNNAALDNVVALSVITSENQVPVFYFDINIELRGCRFDNNVGDKSIVSVNVPINNDLQQSKVILLLDKSTFSNNRGTALNSLIYQFHLRENVVFINNSASSGAAIYLEEAHTLSFDYNANVQFINNTVKQKGGAMYINLVINHCDVFKDISNPSKVIFINNSADIAGNSIFFSIPESCQIITNTSDASSLLYFPSKFNYSQPFYTNTPPVITSPYEITLHPPVIAVHNSSNNYLIQEPKMLGEPIQFTASVLDYFNHITEPVIFSIDCKTCGYDYGLSTHLITVHNQSSNEIKVFPTEPSDVVGNTNVTIKLLSVLSPIYKNISFSLSIKLSSCYRGFLFDKSQRQCICYPHPDIIVHCTEKYSEIKIGYWIGFLTAQYYTSSICPRNYCNFAKRTETSLEYYNLPSKPDDQCSSHRTGIACGECKPGYTLAYDSPDCINTDKCSAGMTILVIVLTILYWIAIVAIVFGLMYFRFKIPLGYMYALIYYYSIVDVLLISDVSEVTSQLVSILSSFARLTPRLFGQLCFVSGLSGIDQQFIHYFHALAISLILLIIVLAAKRSGRLTRFIGPRIIRVICILLLLSYTSLASTSLQLLRPLTFNDVDEVRTYSSPDIKYFTGRHLAYAIIAILCEVIIVIGLPVFLLLEPLMSRLNQRINFVKIKPLLDQFQFSYKGKYRWFAAYYLICRQVIFLIVYVGNGDYYKMLYYLQTACIIIAMIHICFQPYKNNLLNALDGVILLILVLVVNLSTFSFLPSVLSTVLFLLPLLLLICFVAIRKLFSSCHSRNNRMLLYNPVEAYGGDEDDDFHNQRRINADAEHNEFLQDSLLDTQITS